LSERRVRRRLTGGDRIFGFGRYRSGVVKIFPALIGWEMPNWVSDLGNEKDSGLIWVSILAGR